MASLEGIISLGPWGGLGGNHWSYRANRAITQIVLRVERNIKSISLKDATGQDSGTFGGNNPNDSYNGLLVNTSLSFNANLTTNGLFGTACGKPFSTTIANSAVAGFHGTCEKYDGRVVIGSLSFKTNLSTYGPFGTATGTSFSIPIEGSVVIGFHGRGGYYLDAIGIYVKPRDIEGTISIGPWGGQGGSPWSYMTNRGINQIVINVGSNIKSISFRDATGLDSATFGGKNPNDIGERKTVLINWPSEYLISISGQTYGDVKSLETITSLSFTTNKATYGPFGTSSGTSFSIPINDDMVVGFHGRAGYYLDAIGIFVKPKPTTLLIGEGNDDSL
ncbi:hypothetical protein LguiA_007037 [Lonicera macranthoides]